MSDRLADVCVVGGGFAGLMAARALTRAHKEVVVLEARDRLGGRVHTLSFEGAPLDLGGQWIGPTQDRIERFARTEGFDTFVTHGEGQHLYVSGNKTKRFAGTIPPLGPLALGWLGYGWFELDRLAKQVPLDAPWTAKRAREWDGQTLATFLDRHVRSGSARKMFRVAIETVFACDPEDVSLLHALFYIHAAGNLDMLLSTDKGAQRDRFITGAQPVAERLAENGGATIELDSPVRRIEQLRDGVRVSASRMTVRASRVIVAIPPTLAGRIDYDPVLPAARDQLTQRMPQGSVIKCLAVYSEPFWRREGLTGQSLSSDGPLHVTFDASPKSGSPGVLLGFLEGTSARKLADRSTEERRAIVIDNFARVFGARAKNPIHYVDRCWASEPFTRGCYAAYLPPGVWTSYGAALRTPIGRIHWAGTETATRWNGYIEGALQSGERAAAEVLAELA